MKRIVTAVIISLVTIVGAGVGTGFAGEQKVTLKLGGNFCDAYLDEVSEALKKVPGVKEVDLKSMKGHAVVTSEGDKTKPDQLAHAVNGVKGDGWHCTAQAMK